jgi:hypothetical protein
MNFKALFCIPQKLINATQQQHSQQICREALLHKTSTVNWPVSNLNEQNPTQLNYKIHNYNDMQDARHSKLNVDPANPA